MRRQDSKCAILQHNHSSTEPLLTAFQEMELQQQQDAIRLRFQEIELKAKEDEATMSIRLRAEAEQRAREEAACAEAARVAKLKEDEARQKAFLDAKKRVPASSLSLSSLFSLCLYECMCVICVLFLFDALESPWKQMKEEAEQKALDEEARIRALREEAERAARDKAEQEMQRRFTFVGS
jgi:hypothetical protein